MKASIICSLSSLLTSLSRESVNPRPVEFSTLHRLYSHYTIGSVSYSEGVHDDLNKMVWSLLEFDSDYPLREAVEDYVGFTKEAMERVLRPYSS